MTFTGKDKKKKFFLSDLSLIEGGAKGVDALAKVWTVSNGVPVETYKADWTRYGRAAAHRRNAEMVTASDFVLILWDGSSTGTKNDIDLCKKNYKNYKGGKMTKLHTTKILSPREEFEYAKLAVAGDVAARNKLVVSNIPYVIMCAKSFCGYGLSIEDLISEGTLGLIKAIEKFDYTKGFRLITYAKAWIRLFMQEAVNQRCSKKYRLVSLDASIDSDDNESTLGSVLADMDNISVEDECENKVAKEKLWKAIFSLKPNEREIIILHYGLCNHEEHSFEQIGAIKGRTRSRMQQIEKKAFEHLRENLE